jgi:GT2 family glycosyltransferase
VLFRSNGGFAYGNNRPIANLLDSPDSPEFFWLLNPDTVVHVGACSELIRFMVAHPNVGIAGSRLEDPDGTLQVSAFRDHSVVSEFLSGARLGVANILLSRWVVPQAKAYAKPVKVDWVSGASFMVRKSVFEQVGLLDEAYFMYFEEVDFCIRARKTGWECWYVPASRVVHFVGASSGITDNKEKAKRRPAYWFESRRRFFLKNHNGFALLLADFLWMAGYITLIIRRKVQQKQNLDPPCFLRDFFINSAFVKGVWPK